MKDKVLYSIKLALSLALLPIVIELTSALGEHMQLLRVPLPKLFGCGVIAYIVFHIFLYEPTKVFESGKKVTEKAIEIFSPFFKVAHYCIPIYAILCFLFSFLGKFIWPRIDTASFFMFLAGFMFAMHLIMTIYSLRKKLAKISKADYFFSAFLVYLVNILILAGAFSLTFSEFSFVLFIKEGFLWAGNIYKSVFQQLFVVS